MKTKFTTLLALIAFAVSALFSFTGCESTSTSSPVVKLAVQYAALKVVSNNPEKAAKVARIAREVQALAGNEGFNTVDLLMAAVRAKVDFSKLEPADAMLANALIDLVASELKARVGGGVIAEGGLLQVKQVAGWIVEASATIVPMGS
jgi:hypothetical protein